MKESDDWFRQDAVDKAAAEIAAERGCGFDEVKPYQVAKKLGIEKPGGDFYEKVYDWRRRRQAESTVAAIEVPAEATAAFRAALDQFASEAMAEFNRTVRTIAGTIDQTAALRVADAERRRDGSEAEKIDLLDVCRQAEVDRDAALVRVAELQNALGEAQRQADKLTGRLEQRAIDAALAVAQEERTRGAADHEADPSATVQQPVKQIGQVEMPLPVAADPSPDAQPSD